jgi:pimeloyl-ACP methyl ester carboxylesterase
MDERIGVDGINVCYEVKGKGDAVLFIHGIGIGRQAWDPVIAEVSQSYTTYAIDLPGFGARRCPTYLIAYRSTRNC